MRPLLITLIAIVGCGESTQCVQYECEEKVICSQMVEVGGAGMGINCSVEEVCVEVSVAE